MDAPKRTAADGEVLAEHRHRAPVHVADTSDDSIARHGFSLHAKIVAVMISMQPPLHEGTGLEKRLHAFPRAHQTFLASRCEFVDSARNTGGLTALFQLA